MALPQKKTSPSKSPTQSNKTNTDGSKDPRDLIKGRQANDLIIGFCGAIGSGVRSLRLALEESLKEYGYDCHHILISDLILDLSSQKKPSDPYDRYVTLQDSGDSLRTRYRQTVLAEAAIKEISKYREKNKSKDTPLEEKENHRIAFLIDQLKNPAEVELLRLVYQNNFYFIGSLRDISERKRNLRDEGIAPKNIDDLIHRDRKSDNDAGQHSAKTILDADFFIRNNHSHLSELKHKIERFIGLVHGKNGISPTIEEKGMFSAFSSSLQSSCLSRQVGASIIDEDGTVLATGRNDVPKAGGGLYLFEDDKKDYRCIHKGGKCYNDYHKNKNSQKLKSVLSEAIDQLLEDTTSSPEKISTISKELELGEKETRLVLDYILGDRLLKNEVWLKDAVKRFNDKTPIGSLIEYSRAIHAEMDAIVSLARHSNESTSGKILLSTTYPCHNCARHIVAAGIKKVIYIEPYDKSLAVDLHDDAITEQEQDGKVMFQLFEGVAPRRFQTFFTSNRERKKDGIAQKYSQPTSSHIDIQLLESYRDYEDRIVKEHETILGSTNI
ncbi:deoxycytidylate deaminase [Vibrio fluvialis]|nr:deoxycytidylate deaminase [Vibrio fluvialis]